MIDFKKQVIERSFIKPVLVDFWAEWCGPCRMLGPVLGQLAEEQKDRWELVKLNTEEQPDIAQTYKIMSIPNVKLFHNGTVVAEFAGALPKTHIERWLDEHLPDPTGEELTSLLADLQHQTPEQAVASLRKFVEQHPNHKEATMALAKMLAIAEPEKALDLVTDVHLGDPRYEAAEDVRTLAELMMLKPENGAPVMQLLSEAQAALKTGDNETAIQKIIAAIIADKTFHNDLPRRAAIALFHTWGEDHELTRKYRRQFSMALY